MGRIMAGLTMVSETSGSSSSSLVRRRQRPSQPSVRCTTQRRGTTTKPTVPARRRMTTRVSPSRKQASRAASRSKDAVGEHDLEPRVEPLQAPQEVAGAVRVLDVRRVDHHAQQEAGGVDRDVALPALDLPGGIVAARPPLSVVFMLWVSMMAALGLGSLPSRSRSITTRWWRIASQTPALAKARMDP